jgi:hypothetical protein
MTVNAETKRAGTGGTGDARGKIVDVTLLRGRELLSDGALANPDPGVSDPMWAVFGNDTDNLAADQTDHVLGKYALKFDKVNGAANTVYAGIVRTGIDLSASRFLQDGVVSMLVRVPDLTNVSGVELRLGTDENNYQKWTWLDADLLDDQWTTVAKRIDEGVSTTNGWDSEHIKYMAILVSFDAETDTLANIRVDSVMLSEGRPAPPPDRTVTFAQLTTPPNEVTEWVPTRWFTDLLFAVTLANKNASATIRMEGSLDGSAAFNLDPTGDTVLLANGTTYYQIALRVPYVRFVFVSELGGADATLDVTLYASTQDSR